MRLLVWSQYFWPEHFRINEIVKALYKSDIETTILTGKPNYPDGHIFKGYKALGIQREKFEGVNIVRIPIIPRKNNSFVRLFLNYVSFIISGYCIAPFALRYKKIDVVLVYATSPLLQALPALFLAKIKRAPLVIWVQDLWPESLEATGYIKSHFLLWVVKIFVRYLYFSSDSILIQSERFRPSIERFVKNKKKIFYYPNSSEDFKSIYEFSKPEYKVAQEIKQYFSIVFTGNIGSAQSCETIVAAAEKLQSYPAIKFYLIGNGSRFTSISADIKHRKLTNVRMTGRLPPEEMPAIFAASSILLLSLKSNPALSKTIPSKLQSYLSAGKPIIASVDGEAAQVVTKAKAGLSCPADDVNALVTAILHLYNMDPQQRSLFGNNGHQYFKSHFCLLKCVNELIRHLSCVQKGK